jgi:preprotein translocase subunit YajC
MKLLLIIVLAILISFYFIFQPESVTYEKQPPVKLMGTSWKEGQEITIINGTVLKQGDVVAGYRVVEIERGSVILAQNNQVFKLTFNGLIRHSAKERMRYWFQRLLKNYLKQADN